MISLRGVRSSSSRYLAAAVLAAMLLLTACSTQSTAPSAPAPAAPAPAVAPAQSAPAAPKRPTTTAELAIYKGADRQQILEEGAKKEGKVTLYSGSNIDKMRATIDAFQTKYPFLKLDYVRIDSSEIIAKVLQEQQARHYNLDVLNTTIMAPFVDQQIVTPIYSPEMAALPSWAVDEKGMWVARKLTYYGFAYNKDQIPADRVPKDWNSLLDPWWKGKVTTEGQFDPKFWIGVLKHMGEEKGWQYIEAFAKNAVLQRGGTARVTSVASGEYAATQGTDLYKPAELAATKNAPVGYVVMSPTIVNPSSIAITKTTTRPHAAMLLLDFMLSEQGMQIGADGGDLPSRRGVSPKEAWVQNFLKTVEGVDALMLKEEWTANPGPVADRLEKIFR